MIILSKVFLKCHLFPGCYMLQALRLVSDATTISKLGNITSDTFRQLGFSDEKSVKLSEDKILQKRKSEELQKSLFALESLGFTKEDILSLPTVLRLYSKVIIRRFKLLEESGVKTEKISLELLRRYFVYSKQTGKHLKVKGVINENTNIKRSILSYSDLPLHLYPPETDDQPLHKIQANALKCYMKWLLDLTEEQIDNKFDIYLYTYKHRSIREIMQSFQILQNDLKFSKEKIAQHFYLPQIHPEHLMDIIKRVPFIDTKPLKDVAYVYPKILIRPADTILEILQILKDFNLDAKNAAQYPEMFSIAPETVKERVKLFTTDPQYKYLIHNTRLFKCVTNYQLLTNKSRLLKEAKWRCYSADLLATEQQVFDLRFKLRHDHYKGTDIVHFLKKKINIPSKEILKIMSQHVLWNCVPLKTISCTLEFLQNHGFSQEHIISALPLVLYPQYEVEKCLKELNDNPEVECCRNPSTGKLRSELVLQLVLYFLERPFHFTGNGVWELDTEQPQ